MNAIVCRWMRTLLAVALLPAPAALAADGEPLDTWSALDRAAAELAEDVSFLAADITDGSCEPVHELNPEHKAAIGSSFKLYILGELAHQIQSGSFHSNMEQASALGPWEQPVKLEPRYASVPHGPLLFAPEGSVFTVRYLAEQMIQRSDNTATDHLLFLLGREQVEARMGQMGHHDPSLNQPLFATREFAVAKFLWTDEATETYLAASTDERRAILADETRGFAELWDQAADQSTPIHIDTLEWFADRYDMCRALLALHELGQEPETRPVAEILTLEDQIGIDRERFPYVGFKGGSEIGVLAGNWLMERDDGRRFTMTVAFNDREKALDLPAIVPVLQAGVELIYDTP